MPEPTPIRLEAALADLEKILRDLEDGTTSLDVALAPFIDDSAAQESASRNALATFDADFTADNVYGRYADLLTTIASGG